MVSGICGPVVQSTFEYRTMSGSSNGTFVRRPDGPVIEWHLNTGQSSPVFEWSIFQTALSLSNTGPEIEWKVIDHSISGPEIESQSAVRTNLPVFECSRHSPFGQNFVRKSEHSNTGRSGIRMLTVFVFQLRDSTNLPSYF